MLEQWGILGNTLFFSVQRTIMTAVELLRALSLAFSISVLGLSYAKFQTVYILIMCNKDEIVLLIKTSD